MRKIKDSSDPHSGTRETTTESARKPYAGSLAHQILHCLCARTRSFAFHSHRQLVCVFVRVFKVLHGRVTVLLTLILCLAVSSTLGAIQLSFFSDPNPISKAPKPVLVRLYSRGVALSSHRHCELQQEKNTPSITAANLKKNPNVEKKNKSVDKAVLFIF